MSTLRTIRLYGKLGARFGRVHRFHLDTNTVGEAVRALSSQLPGFKSFLANAKQHGMVFAVFAGKRNLVMDELQDPVGNEDIRIAPVIEGSKNAGVLQTVLGVVLIVVGIIGESPWGQAFGGGVWGPAALSAGIAMTAGGVIQMLSPQPHHKVSNGANDPSYVFNGAVNTQAQGHPVPLLYGRMIVGSAVISAGIDAADYSPATAGVGPGSPNWHPTSPFEVAP